MGRLLYNRSCYEVLRCQDSLAMDFEGMLGKLIHERMSHNTHPSFLLIRGMIVDAGSGGTRIHVYEWKQVKRFMNQIRRDIMLLYLH